MKNCEWKNWVWNFQPKGFYLFYFIYFIYFLLLAFRYNLNINKNLFKYQFHLIRRHFGVRKKLFSFLFSVNKFSLLHIVCLKRRTFLEDALFYFTACCYICCKWKQQHNLLSDNKCESFVGLEKINSKKCCYGFCYW